MGPLTTFTVETTQPDGAAYVITGKCEGQF